MGVHMVVELRCFVGVLVDVNYAHIILPTFLAELVPALLPLLSSGVVHNYMYWILPLKSSTIGVLNGYYYPAIVCQGNSYTKNE